MVDEVRMAGEVVCLAVLKYKQAVFLQQLVAEDEVGQCLQPVQLIGRVGKHEVELRVAGLDVAEGIAAQREALVCFHFFHYFADEGVVVAVLLHAHYLLASARQQLDADAACPGKEVQGVQVAVLEVQVV